MSDETNRWVRSLIDGGWQRSARIKGIVTHKAFQANVESAARDALYEGLRNQIRGIMGWNVDCVECRCTAKYGIEPLALTEYQVSTDPVRSPQAYFSEVLSRGSAANKIAFYRALARRANLPAMFFVLDPDLETIWAYDMIRGGDWRFFEKWSRDKWAAYLTGLRKLPEGERRP
jgi:hypothetical protein